MNLRERIDEAYAEHGQLNIHDGVVPINDIGWVEIVAAIVEEVERMPRVEVNIYLDREERVAYWHGIEDELANIVALLKGRL